jgi:hypothetical protein
VGNFLTDEIHYSFTIEAEILHDRPMFALSGRTDMTRTGRYVC